MRAADSPWHDFVMAVYHAEGVSAASILLQDRCGVDVNVVLLAAYVGAVRGGAFGQDDLAEARRLTGPWQTEVVTPLRAVRRRLKHGPPPSPGPATDALRERIKAIELDAELIELEVLASLAEHTSIGPGVGTPRARAAAAMHVVLTTAAGRDADSDETEAVETIAAAAADQRRPK